MLLFRGQTLDDDDMIAFSRRFGELDFAPIQENGRRFVDGHPEIYVVSNVLENAVAYYQRTAERFGQSHEAVAARLGAAAALRKLGRNEEALDLYAHVLRSEILRNRSNGPALIDADTVGIAGQLVAAELVERMLLVGPLPGPVGACHD